MAFKQLQLRKHRVKASEASVSLKDDFQEYYKTYKAEYCDMHQGKRVQSLNPTQALPELKTY